jgi:hypothetical protein
MARLWYPIHTKERQTAPVVFDLAAELLKCLLGSRGHGIILRGDDVICARCEVLSCSQLVIALKALASVHCAFIDFIWTLGGFVSSIPAIRSLAASVSVGPWI